MFDVVQTPGESAIFRCIRRQAGISRVELSAQTGLTSAAVTQIVKRLMNAGLVEETSERYPAIGGTGGRLRIGLRVSADQFRALGITVRRFDLLWGLVTLSGQLECSWRTPIDDKRPWRDDMVRTMQEIRQYGDQKKIEIVATGIGFPTFRLPWSTAGDVTHLITHHFASGRVYTGHNGSYAALAEDWLSTDTRKVRNWLYVFLGAGIGGAVVEGRNASTLVPRISSVEAGHVGIDPKGPPCFCGNRGCVELIASPLALANQAHLDLSSGFAALTQIGREVKQDASRALGYGLLSIVNILDLETIIMGGQDGDIIEDVYGGVREFLRCHVTPSQRSLDVRVSTLGEYSGVVGAALGALDQVGQEVVAVSTDLLSH